jgi:hypothetical protein
MDNVASSLTVCFRYRNRGFVPDFVWIVNVSEYHVKSVC